MKLRLRSMSWRDLLLVAIPALLVLLLAASLIVKSVRFAPPKTIRLASGPVGSSYRNQAERYKKIIARHGVNVEIITSKGALDNLEMLRNPAAKVDVAFVQGGLKEENADAARTPEAKPPETKAPGGAVPEGKPAEPKPPESKSPEGKSGDAKATDSKDEDDDEGLMSLGSLFAQPIMVYCRSAEPVDMLTQLKGKRLAIGRPGSGTRVLASKLLKANEMDKPPTVLLEIGGEEASKALLAGEIDAAFLMGDSATPQVMRSLRAVPGIELASFRQADGYLRKFRFLSKLTLPEGAMDLAKNYPPRTLDLVGPTVELVAREDLHPALSDLLIGAAREIHGRPGLFRNAGEYPAPLARDFPISRDAERYYKSGEQFLYKRLPFWLASLIDRIIVVLLPLLVIVVPATRIIPALYRWRVRSRIYRWYGLLMAIEREMQFKKSDTERAAILARIDDIAHSVNEIKTPLSFADQLYVLRDHVTAVRRRLQRGDAA